MSEERDWWRGNSDQQRTALKEAVLEGEKRDDSALFDSMFIGATAYRVMKGVGSNEHVAVLIAQMIADCEVKIRQESLVMLGEVDTASPIAREAHFNARVAAGMISLLNDYVARGSEAQDIINDVDNQPRMHQ